MTQLLSLLLLAALAASCRQTRCEDLVAAAVEGSYRGGGSLGEERLLRVGVEASSEEVVLTYTTLDGSRIRAKYRVVKQTKRP